MNKKTLIGEIVTDYLEEYGSDISTIGLARILYNENKTVFRDVEHARKTVRTYRGSAGKEALSKLSDDRFLPPTKYAEKYNLPASYETIYEPFIIDAQKMLIMSDIHIPYHSVMAVEAVIEWAIGNAKKSGKRWDAILLNGDILDCYQLSSFDRDPRVRSFKAELDAGKKFLTELQARFDCPVYWVEGNHEQRYERFMLNKAPELLGINEYRFDNLLGMKERQCTYIRGKRIVKFDKLNIIHGHEYKSVIGGGGVNPARGLFLRGKGNAVCGHWHQTSDHTEPTIDGKVISCWSLGCLSELHPHYMPLNRWNHGFGEVEMVNGQFHFENHRIIDGVVH